MIGLLQAVGYHIGAYADKVWSAACVGAQCSYYHIVADSQALGEFVKTAVSVVVR